VSATLLALLLACHAAPVGTLSDSGGGDGGGTEDGGADTGPGPTDGGGSVDGGADTASDGGGDGGGDDTGVLPVRSCLPQSDLADPNFLEGDTVTFGLHCAGDLAPADAVLSVVGLPDGATLDAGTWTLSWATGPADGGKVELLFSVRPKDGSSFPETLAVSFWVADNPALVDNVPVDPLSYTEEWGLPVMHLQTHGALSESYGPTDVTWLGHSYPGQVKIRGAASSYYPKNSMTLKFDTEQLDVPAWGNTMNHVVLTTSFDDNSYVRQKLSYDQWAAIADFWGDDRILVRTQFVVVYMDGAYWGLYTMMDHVDNELVRQMGFDDTGDLYKAVDHDANFSLQASGGGAKTTLHQGYEKKEGDPLTDFSSMDELVSFTGNSSAQDLVDHADADGWFHLDEFMDWLLFVCYASADDSAGKNSYIYDDPGGSGYRYTPWDFNHSWGQGWYTYRISSSEYTEHTGYNRVFWAITSVPETDAEMWDRFRAMREPGGPFDPDWIRGQVDDYYTLIDPSAQRDWEKWGDSYHSYSGWSSARNAAHDWTTYTSEKAYVYRWLDDRAALFEGMVP